MSLDSQSTEGDIVDIRGTVFAVSAAAMYAAHQVADHWAQTDHQAGHKGDPGEGGALACAAHVATYTAITAGSVMAASKALGVPVPSRALLAGQAIVAVSHYVMDRRPWGRAIMRAAGSGGFAALGAPREGRDDNPTFYTGAYALDQSWHIGWAAVAALVTAALSR